MIPLREIQEKLAFLRQHGAEAAAPDLKSTEKDLYALHPVMSAAAVLTFEAKLGLRLPEDFRTFITQVGNGGVGPFSGLSDRSLNTIGWYVKSLMPFQWDDLVQVKKLSLAEFNSEIKSELVSHLRSFERYLKSQSRYRELMKSYYDIQLAEDEYIAYGPLHGCLPIYHYPGGGMAYLVVAGPELGRVLRGPGHAGEKGGGRYELKGQFPAFYLEWLDNSIRKILFREYYTQDKNRLPAEILNGAAPRVIFAGPVSAFAASPFFIDEEGVGCWLGTDDQQLLQKGAVVSSVRNALHLPSVDRQGEPLVYYVQAVFILEAKRIGLDQESRARGYWTLSDTGAVQQEAVRILYTHNEISADQLRQLAWQVLQGGDQDAVAIELRGKVEVIRRSNNASCH